MSIFDDSHNAFGFIRAQTEYDNQLPTEDEPNDMVICYKCGIHEPIDNAIDTKDGYLCHECEMNLCECEGYFVCDHCHGEDFLEGEED